MERYQKFKLLLFILCIIFSHISTPQDSPAEDCDLNDNAYLVGLTSNQTIDLMQYFDPNPLPWVPETPCGNYTQSYTASADGLYVFIPEVRGTQTICYYDCLGKGESWCDSVNGGCSTPPTNQFGGAIVYGSLTASGPTFELIGSVNHSYNCSIPNTANCQLITYAGTVTSAVYYYNPNSSQDQPESDTGKPEDAEDPCSGNSGAPAGDGFPVWSVNKVNLNHYVTDTPLWYKPAYGPSVDIQISYNSLTALSGPVPNSPFGPKWQFNYASYIVENPANNPVGSVMIVMPDGREDIYTPNGNSGYNQPFGIFNTLTHTGQQYTVTFLDGTVYTYAVPSGMSRIVLTNITDAYNLSLSIDYDSTSKLIDVRDALNRTTTFHYNGQGLVDSVTDPFNRQAQFSYDPSTGNLTGATDMGGFTAIYIYDAVKNYLSEIKSPKITNPQSDADYRIWSFLLEPNDSATSPDAYPAPGSTGNYMGNKYRLTITNPNNPDGTQNKEEYFYFGPYAWHVSPRDYVAYVNATTNNYTNAPKTLYFYDESTSYPKGRILRTVTPLGNSQTFTYYQDSTLPTFGQVASITDSNNNTKNYQYNSNGLVTNFWDAKTPTTSAPTISYTYYPNDIDVQNIINGLGSISYTYNASHAVTAMTDRMNVRTAFSYNGFGQLISVVEAATTSLATTMTLNYDSNARTLSNICNSRTCR